MGYILNGDRMVMGTDYYPEHWDEEMWETDLDRQRAAGIEVIRIAEFAWNKFEPRESEFGFDFFDRFLNLCASKGMKVIFCTPTATPPAWLTEKYPEVLNCRMDGTPMHHGARRHYNYNASVYQRLSVRLVKKLAEHYGPNECVIGWQIDNEVNCEVNEFYSQADDEAFREFVKNKYGTIEAVNDAWGTVFWNQTYSFWREIHIPRTTVNPAINPHLMLDYKRFVSESARRWVKMQSDAIRPFLKEGDFITTNGLFGNLDSHKMTAESLDFLTYDSYPNMAFGLDDYERNKKGLRDRMWSVYLTEVRSISPKFGIMEQQSGANGWTIWGPSPSPKPGQITLWTMQSVAHGADFISYFRWRTATFGTEMYWHGILDYSGRDNRRLAEVTVIHTMLEKLAPVAGAKYRAEVGILESSDNKWDGELDRWHGRLAEESRNGIFSAALNSHTPVDLVYLQDTTQLSDLTPYKVLVYPHAVLLREEEEELLEQYVEQGGTLVLGARAGQKDDCGQCRRSMMPGLLRKLTGADVTEYGFTSPEDARASMLWESARLECGEFVEELQPLEGGKVLGRYDNLYIKGVPALISKESGQGITYYYGSSFTEETARFFLRNLGVMNPYEKYFDLPKSVELAVRAKEETEYIFLLNYGKEPANIKIRQELQNVITEQRMQGNVTIPGYGVLVLKK